MPDIVKALSTIFASTGFGNVYNNIYFAHIKNRQYLVERWSFIFTLLFNLQIYFLVVSAIVHFVTMHRTLQMAQEKWQQTSKQILDSICTEHCNGHSIYVQFDYNIFYRCRTEHLCFTNILFEQQKRNRFGLSEKQITCVFRYVVLF